MLSSYPVNSAELLNETVSWSCFFLRIIFSYCALLTLLWFYYSVLYLTWNFDENPVRIRYLASSSKPTMMLTWLRDTADLLDSRSQGFLVLLYANSPCSEPLFLSLGERSISRNSFAFLRILSQTKNMSFSISNLPWISFAENLHPTSMKIKKFDRLTAASIIECWSPFDFVENLPAQLILIAIET